MTTFVGGALESRLVASLLLLEPAVGRVASVEETFDRGVALDRLADDLVARVRELLLRVSGMVGSFQPMVTRAWMPTTMRRFKVRLQHHLESFEHWLGIKLRRPSAFALNTGKINGLPQHGLSQFMEALYLARSRGSPEK